MLWVSANFKEVTWRCNVHAHSVQLGRLAGGFQAFKELNACIETSSFAGSSPGNFDSVGTSRNADSVDAASRLRYLSLPFNHPSADASLEKVNVKIYAHLAE